MKQYIKLVLKSVFFGDLERLAELERDVFFYFTSLFKKTQERRHEQDAVICQLHVP